MNDDDRRPCRGVNSNICAAEGCFGEACRSTVKTCMFCQHETESPDGICDPCSTVLAAHYAG